MRWSWRQRFYGEVAKELGYLGSCYTRIIQFDPQPEDCGTLFRLTKTADKHQMSASEYSAHKKSSNSPEVLLLNGNLNASRDVDDLLHQLHLLQNREDRLAAVLYNPYLWPIFRMFSRLGLTRSATGSSFLTMTSLTQLCRLTGYELVRVRPVAHVPCGIPLLDKFLGRFLSLIPLVRWMLPCSVAILRPKKSSKNSPVLSVIVPARNEAGNIARIFAALSGDIGYPLELILVEGHSRDNTWDEINKHLAQKSSNLNVKAYQQPGVGKCDAVRFGFEKATGDILTILDADLTVPAASLRRFYEAHVTGLADFINGTRLVHPIEAGAMQTLNRIGNAFFAKALSLVLGIKISDSLCGTKLISREHYNCLVQWRRQFGEFDPFGDFDLLFGASQLGLTVAEVPIHYGARTYGSTNIQRFRHGWMLLKMTAVGFLRIRLRLW